MQLFDVSSSKKEKKKAIQVTIKERLDDPSSNNKISKLKN